jgi:hypothetical protein
VKESFITRAEHVWSDIVVLSLYYMLGVGLLLVTDQWLHWAHLAQSPAILILTRSGRYVWGAVAIIIVLGAVFLSQRAFGIAAVIAWVALRSYDFKDDGHPNWFFLSGLAIYVILALRGTYWRTIIYGRTGSQTDRQ